MTKSVYEFWISQGKDKLRLPVLPDQLSISLEDTMKEAVEITEIPAANEKQCGQAKLHDLEGAKRLMRFWLSQDKEELLKVFG